jgi:hypothetical protein
MLKNRPIFYMAVLKLNVDFRHNVDWSGRCSTPAGAAGQVRPRRRLRRGGSAPAPRKASTWSGNQHAKFITAIYIKSCRKNHHH